ncbi:hypothetical protein D030_1075A, partial [Vibrio parahaemolyticus AQ3810]
MKLTVAFG